MNEGDKVMKPRIDLRRLQRRRGWTQEYTAAELGFCRSYISAVENGKQGVSVDMMNAIIRIFGVKYEDFYNKANLKEG